MEQSALRMLAWATRWKIGIYQSIRRAKMMSRKMSVPIWKIWDLERTDEPEKKVDKRQITASRKHTKKYKATRITTKMKVTGRMKSTSQVTEQIKGKTFVQATFDDLETVVLEKNDALYGDAFND